MAITNFKDKVSEQIASGVSNKRTQKKLPSELQRIAVKKLQILRAAKKLSDLRNFPGLRLEKLKGARKLEHSIRINDQFRICFKWQDSNAVDVIIEDYH